MSRNIFHPTTDRNVARNRRANKETHQKPGAFKWWTPDCDFTDPDIAANGCTGEEPPLENGWAQPTPGSGMTGNDLELFAFRLHSDGSLEFKGHLDAAGAASDTVALTLPGDAVGEPDFRPAKDQFFITTIWDGATFMPAAVYIDSDLGEVTITFPI